MEIYHSKTWDAEKRVQRGKFTVIDTYIKKKESSQINYLTLHFKKVEKKS